jgi:hypothetical protein
MKTYFVYTQQPGKRETIAATYSEKQHTGAAVRARAKVAWLSVKGWPTRVVEHEDTPVAPIKILGGMEEYLPRM